MQAKGRGGKGAVAVAPGIGGQIHFLAFPDRGAFALETVAVYFE